MINKRKLTFLLLLLCSIRVRQVATTTSTTVVTPKSSSAPVNPVSTESNNNVELLIIGIAVGIVVVVLTAVLVGVCYSLYRKKKKQVHPHSDTETFYSRSESETESRPTTASHIHLDPEPEEAMSKPVTMTPFELRKLYVETFPYTKWKKGFDGSLRPHMSLKFMNPRLYARTKGDERSFRDKILNYELSDSITLRSSALSRMMQQTKMPTMKETMEPVTEPNELISPSDSQEVTPKNDFGECQVNEETEIDAENVPAVNLALTNGTVGVDCDVELM
ncbi:uncharacterized protein LOC127866737 [Dreissena polymorpha]|uniref:Uncharacterized protein n=1 Tax=Dreissena polymorpha TaxID=45954 RepID=A0A9D4MZ33_DREPO|nr:uncharacterized protein LOC127866737 [Dreissena polymorpha]KAH3886608.1 hypothetical protein DPMN_010619 [Dreissena polymorpha]